MSTPYVQKVVTREYMSLGNSLTTQSGPICWVLLCFRLDSLFNCCLSAMIYLWSCFCVGFCYFDLNWHKQQVYVSSSLRQCDAVWCEAASASSLCVNPFIHFLPSHITRTSICVILICVYSLSSEFSTKTCKKKSRIK